MSPTTSLHDDNDATRQGSPSTSLRDENDATEQQSQDDETDKAAADETERADPDLGNVSVDAAAKSSDSNNVTRDDNGDDAQLQTSEEGELTDDKGVDRDVKTSDAQDEHEVVPPSTDKIAELDNSHDKKTESQVNEPVEASKESVEQETSDDTVDQIETRESIDTSMEDEIKQDNEDIHEANTDDSVGKQETRENITASPEDNSAQDNERNMHNNETSAPTDEQAPNQKRDVNMGDTPDEEQKLHSVEDKEDYGLREASQPVSKEDRDLTENDQTTKEGDDVESKNVSEDDSDVSKEENKTQTNEDVSKDIENEPITKSDEKPNTEIVDDINANEDGGKQYKMDANDDAVDDSVDGAAENNVSQEDKKSDGDNNGSMQMDETENSSKSRLEKEAVSSPEPKDTINSADDDAERTAEDDTNDHQHGNNVATSDVSEEKDETPSEPHETVDGKVESDNDIHSDQPIVANEQETYHRANRNDDEQTQENTDDVDDERKSGEDEYNEQKVVQKDDQNHKQSSVDKTKQKEQNHRGEQDSEQNKTQIRPTEKNNSTQKQTENRPRNNSTTQKRQTGSRQSTKPSQNKSQPSPRSEDDRKRQTRSASSRQRLLNRPTTDEQATRPKTTGGQTKGSTDGRNKQREFFQQELKRLQSSLQKDASKIQKHPVKKYFPNVNNSLEPYFNTETTQFIIELPEDVRHQPRNRVTATGLCDPWVDHEMDKLPEVDEPKKKDKSEKDRKNKEKDKDSQKEKRPPKKGSTRLPKYPVVTMDSSELAKRQLTHSDVPMLRKELHDKYSANAENKIEEDYTRTKDDFYRMELDKMDEVHPKSRKNLRKSYFAYLQNTPGSKKAVYECVKEIEQK